MDTNFRDHRIYLVHLLRVLGKYDAASPADIYDEVADRAGISEEQRKVQGGVSTWNPVYRNRIQFARQSLVDAGLVIGSAESGWRRGIWELSAEGKRLASSATSDAELDAMLRDKAAVGARARAEERKGSLALAGLDAQDNAVEGDPLVPRETDSDEDQWLSEIGDQVETANDAVLRTMLDHVRSLSDNAFEYLVGDVLRAALRAETVKVMQQSRDGGIDGVLTFDALGIRLAVYQAKRYAEGNVVGRPAVDAFATAARRRRAAHALFVTTSKFSHEAVEAARDEGLRLIDGTALVELMAQHNFGLRVKEQYVLYEIDPSWTFEAGEDG